LLGLTIGLAYGSNTLKMTGKFFGTPKKIFSFFNINQRFVTLRMIFGNNMIKTSPPFGAQGITDLRVKNVENPFSFYSATHRVIYKKPEDYIEK